MGDYLAEFEHLVALALVRLGAEAYGMAVRREIVERTEREVSIGSVYSTLDRLERKGLVTSSTSAPTPVRGGRAKRCFRLTAEGEKALARSQRVLEQMAQGLSFEGAD